MVVVQVDIPPLPLQSLSVALFIDGLHVDPNVVSNYSMSLPEKRLTREDLSSRIFRVFLPPIVKNPKNVKTPIIARKTTIVNPAPKNPAPTGLIFWWARA